MQRWDALPWKAIEPPLEVGIDRTHTRTPPNDKSIGVLGSITSYCSRTSAAAAAAVLPRLLTLGQRERAGVPTAVLS